MINTETIERNENNGKKTNWIIKKAAMFFVALLCCVVATASSSWLSSERVVAVGGVPVIVNKVTQEDINNAKKKRDNAKAEAKKAQEKISSLKDQAVGAETAVMGEVGLAGEIRTVPQCERRVAECARLGFTTLVVPRENARRLQKVPEGVRILGVDTVMQALSVLF